MILEAQMQIVETRQ